MKLKIIAFTLLFSLSFMFSIASAETTEDIDVLAIIEEMPYESRMEVVDQILRMVAKNNGIDALEALYQQVVAEYPVQSNASEPAAETGEITEESLAELLASQPVYVVETEYIVQSDEYKALYPDMLSAIIQNNSGSDILDAVVAFVAWDSNNLPVKIEGQFDFGGGSYVKKVNYDAINLVSGETFGRGYGMTLSDENNISTFKGIVVSYTTFEGETWENPYFKDFCDMYEGKKLTTP